MILFICVSIRIYAEKKLHEGVIFINGEKAEAVALISKRDVLVPMIPILKEYGYEFEYQSDTKIIMKKGVYTYHMDLTELTIHEVTMSQTYPLPQLPPNTGFL